MSAITIDVVRQGPTFVNAFWLTGVLLRMIVVVIICGLSLTNFISMPVFAVIVLLDLTAFVWSIIRYNAAANSHLHSTGHFWAVTGGYFFYLLACLTMVAMWWLLFDRVGLEVAGRNTTHSQVDLAFNNTRFETEISRNQRQLIFKGIISNGAAEEIAQQIDKTKTLETLILNSAGGNVFEAREMAREVQKRQVNTHVANECNASCLLVYMAGQHRTMGPGAKLGFHAYGLDFSQVLPHVNPLNEMAEDQRYYLSRGVELGFVEEIFAFDRKAIWYPGRQTLIGAGVVNGKAPDY